MSDRNLAVLVRQLALHCNLAAQIQKSLQGGRDPYSSNWLERLRQIKRIRTKVAAAAASTAGEGADSAASSSKANDFTKMIRTKD